MMLATMTPCLRRVASAPCSSIGCNGRSARQGSLMIAPPLRGGQESWWGVGAIQLSCCDVPQQDVPAIVVKIPVEQRDYCTIFVYLINLPLFRRSIKYKSTKKHKNHKTKFTFDDMMATILVPHMQYFTARKSS